MANRGRVIKADQMPRHHLEPYEPSDDLEKLRVQLDQASARLQSEKEAAAAEIQRLYDEAAQRGYQEGYAKGVEEGRIHAESESRDRLDEECKATRQAIETAIAAVVARIDEARSGWIEKWDQSALDLICSIASRVTRKAIKLDASVAERTLREILALVARTPRITAHLHPDDLDLLTSQKESFDHLRPGRPSIEFVPDPTLERGGCRVDTEFCSIDADVAVQIDKLLQEVAGVSAGGNPTC